MSTAAEILVHALALPAEERAGLAQSLLHSLPDGPPVYRDETEMAAELTRRMQEFEAGNSVMVTEEEALQRARDALARSRVR